MELIALSAALVAVIATVIVAIHVQHLEDDLRLLWDKALELESDLSLDERKMDENSDRARKNLEHISHLSAEIVKMQERIGDVEENNDASKAIMEGFTNIMSFSSQKGKGEE